MSNTERVDKNLFREEHYLGKPADDADKIITRRIDILNQYPEFFVPGADIIEVGSGSGATINRIANRFRTALGIDIFDYAEPFKKQQQMFNASNSSFVRIDLENEKLNQKFDRLLSFEVIEHLKTDDSVSKYAELLNEGGLAAITVPNKWWIFETHGARLPLLPWNRVPFFSWLPRPIHERFANARIYTRKRILNLLRKHDFEIIDWRYVTAPMDVLKEGRLKRFVTRYIFRNDTTSSPFLATSIFVIARKKKMKGSDG